MAELIQAMTGAFQAAIAGVQMPAPTAVMLGLALERLRNLGGVEFRGLSPEASEAWLASTERIMEQMGCDDARRLGCVVSLL